jgi:acyl-CoA thioester hydrolase
LARAQPWTRSGFPHFLDIQTRWMDNDIYGHVNNATYYSYFDTVVNRYLIDTGVLDLQSSAVIGLVVETMCSYFQEIAFPDKITAGLRVAHIGRTSVKFEIALFRNEEQGAAAQGHFVHVYVDRATRHPAELEAAMKKSLAVLTNQPD